jgi:hypothetical protein
MTYIESFRCCAALAASLPLALEVFTGRVDGGRGVRGQRLLQLTLRLSGILRSRRIRRGRVGIRHRRVSDAMRCGGSTPSKQAKSRAQCLGVKVVLRVEVLGSRRG